MSDYLRTSRPDRQGSATPGLECYTGTAQVLHWITVAFLLAVLPLGWVAVSLPEGSAGQGIAYAAHKSAGVTILALVLARLLWRAAHPPPPDVDGHPALRVLARANHWALYAVFIVMPVSGYLLSAEGDYPLHLYGLVTIPPLPKNEALAKAAQAIHLGGQWAVYGLVLLHVAATVWHVAARRDGVLDRMLPPRRS